jgi:hypothetical protein
MTDRELLMTNHDQATIWRKAAEALHEEGQLAKNRKYRKAYELSAFDLEDQANALDDATTYELSSVDRRDTR